MPFGFRPRALRRCCPLWFSLPRHSTRRSTVGLHTGEVERTSDDVVGLAVHLTAHITSLAATGEILVSRTVRDLVIGSELRFTDRGEHELKGIPTTGRSTPP